MRTNSMDRWRIRRTDNGAGWNVWRPDGQWSGYFETWAGALSWATDGIQRLEYWLAHQTT